MGIVEEPSFDFITLGLLIFSVPVGYWFVVTERSSLRQKRHLDTAITPVMALVLCALMLVLGGIGTWWGAGRVSFDPIEKSAWMYASFMTAQVPILLAYAYLQHRYRSKHVAGTAILTFVVFVPMTLAVAGVAHQIFIALGWEPASAVGHETLTELLAQPLWKIPVWVVIVCVTLGAGIVEEVMFRGLLLPFVATVLGGKTAWPAIYITSVLFALMHIGPAQPSAILGLFVLSIGLCWARVKTGGILAPIAIHILFNAMNIAIAYSTEL